MSNSMKGINSFDPEIIHLLKNGNSFLVPEEIKTEQCQVYPMDFVLFMEQMLKEKKMKRKTVAARSGLSEDYTYKLLNGNKKTTERDYILAICLALRLSLAQTQHALRCLGMPLLGRGDTRANLIMLGIENGLDMYRLNEYLEAQHLPMIKISPDMPSAPITDSMFSMSAPNANEQPPKKEACEYEIIESHTASAPFGNTWFDFNICGVMTVEDPDTKEKFHLSCAYHSTGESNFVVQTEEQFQEYQREEEAGEDISPDLFIESYETLLDAAGSAFFASFMELDHLTDVEMENALRKADDTQYYGHRIGSHWMGGSSSPEIYIELFNAREPGKMEYYQMIENKDGEITYSASHDSYFLRMDAGELYDLYYPSREEMRFFLKTDNAGFDKLPMHEKMIFNALRHILHEQVRSEGGFVSISDGQFYKEEGEFFAEQFTLAMRMKDYDKAKEYLNRCNDCLLKSSRPFEEKTLVQLVNERKLMRIAHVQGDDEEYLRLEESIINKMGSALKDEAALKDNAPKVYTVIADAILDKWRRLQNHETVAEHMHLLEDVLLLMDHKAFSDPEENAIERFEVYESYAFCIDETDPEKAEDYYRKAISEVTKYHLDMEEGARLSVATAYNNYAWVLWNKLGSEEAVIYYGRALELIETYYDMGLIDKEAAIMRLTHYGNGLYQIYEDTSKEKELKRLENRLRKYGVVLGDL